MQMEYKYLHKHKRKKTGACLDPIFHSAFPPLFFGLVTRAEIWKNHKLNAQKNGKSMRLLPAIRTRSANTKEKAEIF